MNRTFILRIISILMVVGLAVVIIVSMSKTSGSSKSVDEVAPNVIALFENDNAHESPERLFKKYYGFNASDYDGVVLYSPDSNVEAEELLIVKMADESQADELIEAVQERLDSQMTIFDGYEPEQYALCQKAVIDHQGNYLLFVIHADADKIDAAFRKALK